MRRRDALELIGGAVATTALAGLSPARAEEDAPMSLPPMPTVYLPHGGGPWPFVDRPMFDPAEEAALAGYLRDLPAAVGRPKAMVVISAHWEQPLPTVTTAARPPMLYDYRGFPPESYRITWPAPGDPALAARVRALLAEAGFESAEDGRRGFDHGTFVPLKLSFPEADVPTIQLSLLADLDPARHIAMGRALAPLRRDGVLIVGSGMSYHDLRGLMRGTGRADSEAFHGWLHRAATAPAKARDALLAGWSAAPAARASHPREEHLLPLMVIAGAAGDDPGRVAWSGHFAGARVSAIHYG